MFFINICGLTVHINNTFDDILALSADYIVTSAESPDIILSVTPEEAAEEAAKYPQYTDSYIEGLILFKKLSMAVIPYNIFFLHSAAVSKDGNGYLFCGKSGVGKSTHALIWEKTFPDCFIINGDKPLVKYENGRFFVYGTPWCGKEMRQKNAKAPVAGVAFINRAEDNKILPMDSSEALKLIFNQTVYTKNPELNEKLFWLIDKFITEVPFYRLYVNMSDDAAITAFDEMKKGKKI